MKKIYISILSIGLLLMATSAGAVEPSMVNYEAIPVFSAQSTAPNVMIILDNSGSMNYYAYGTWPGSGGTVTDQPFAGEPYDGTVNVQITSRVDDVEEGFNSPSTTYDDSGDNDLDLGGFSTAGSPSYVGVRFPGIEIPQGATITSAYIDFVARRTETVATSLTIEGEDSGDAAPFNLATDNIKNRTAVTDVVGGGGAPLTVPWTPGNWDWGLNYQTPDLSALVQQIVNRSDWDSDNAMVFRFSGTGKRDARSRNYGSASAPVLRIQYSGGQTTRYYGLFNPDFFYTYNGSRFEVAYKKVYPFDAANNRWNATNLSGGSSTLNSAAIVSGGLWDGNWLNWVAMRRIDVLRKVLFGGDTANGGTSGRDGSGVQNLYSEHDGSYWYRWFDSSSNIAVSPYHGNYQYRMYYGDIRVDGHDYNLVVEKNVAYEPDEFLDYDGGENLAGIIQRIGDSAKWGNIWFRYGNGSGNEGGYLENPIGADIVDIVNDLEAKDPGTWTPLAETFYVAMQYFRQEETEISGYNALLDSTKGDANDPYYRNGQAVPCAKSFVILLTDGASTMDARIPSQYKDLDSDGDRTACAEYSNSDCDYPSYGTDFLDDLALFAHTEDLRPEMGYGTTGLGDYERQSISLYAIYAFGNDDDARSLLRDAARNGGFIDRDGDNRPDGDFSDPPEDRLEWDADSDGEPDTYFEANDGYALEAKLLTAISDILKQATSGTAASVLSTNTEGAGNSVQAYFRPLETDGYEEARWRGYLETLWVDPWGNLREDTTGNKVLDLKNTSNQNAASGATDRIVEFVIGINGDTVARIYSSHYLYNPDNGDSWKCGVSDCSVVFDDLSLNDMNPLFEAGSVLANRDIATAGRERKIFTYIGSPDAANSDTSVDTSGDVILFDSGMATEIKPFLGLSDQSNTQKWDAYGSTADDRVTNLITYIQGTDIAGLRNRTLSGVTWRLGDIVHSTPIVVASPAERFHQLYNDESYAEFLAAFIDRETMIYVGGNDGMMHAFTSWQYTEDSDGNPMYTAPAGAASDEMMGDELWAYIPQSLLPHLKWYGLPDYTHTYYVDGEPRVFDADILPDDEHYSDSDSDPNYGTFMVFGMGMGGKSIDVDEDFGAGVVNREFSPTYVLMDITEPRNPRLMWERTYDNLGMSYSVPAPVRVGDQWFLVFGSGPSEYDGTSDNGGYIYVVDLETGDPIGSGGNDWLFGEIKTVDPLNNNAGNGYFNDPLVLDIFQSANADAIYLANNYYDGSGWASDIIKITVPCYSCPWDGFNDDQAVYEDDPSQWERSDFFYSDRPVSVKLSASTDPLNNLLIYFGTGRYLSPFDQTDTDQQYMYGIKDPFYNSNLYEGKNGSHYHNFGTPKGLSRSDLFASDGIEVTTSGNVLGLASGVAEFSQFVNDMRWNEDGWYLSLITNGTLPSERIITRSAILGGIVLTPTFTPNSDICGMGGDTQLLGVYYETGTGYTTQIFDIDDANLRTTTVTTTNADGTTSTSTEEIVEIRNDKILKGTPAPKIVFHVGLEGGATSKLQMSNRGEGGGSTNTLYFRSMITEWWDRLE